MHIQWSCDDRMHRDGTEVHGLRCRFDMGKGICIKYWIPFKLTVDMTVRGVDSSFV